MATIRKRGDKWQVQARRKGCPPVSRTFLHKADAKTLARQTELQADRVGLPADVSTLKRQTVSDLVIRYLAEIVPRKRGGEKEAPALRAFLKHRFARTILINHASDQFACYRDERLMKVKGATVRRELAVLRHCFEIAEGSGVYQFIQSLSSV